MEKNVLEKIRFEILSAKQMKALDNAEKGNSVEKGYALMQEAGNAFFNYLIEEWKELKTAKKQIAIFIGSGNNGGDGLVVAKHMIMNGIPHKAYLIKNPEELKNEAAMAFKDFKDAGGVFFVLKEDEKPDLENTCLVIDSLLGIGAKGNLKPNYESLVKYLKESKIPVVAVDCPTVPLKAKATLVFGYCRSEIFEEAYWSCYGKWKVAPLAYKQELEDIFSSRIYGIADDKIWQLLPKRNEWGDKRSQGTGLLIAGSFGMVGAASLCGKAALHSGIGLLSMAVPKSLFSLYATKLDEAVFLPYEDFNQGQISKDNLGEVEIFLKNQRALAIGPGISNKECVKEFVRLFLPKVSVPMVIDADALNAFEGCSEYLKHLKTKAIITPHVREWERLFGKLPQESEEKHETLRQVAREYGLTIILKGGVSNVVLPNGEIYFVGTPNSGLAKGGSGDVLTGILLGLLSQGISTEIAAILGTWIHSKAGLKARDKFGTFGMLPSDVVNVLGEVFCTLEKEMTNNL